MTGGASRTSSLLLPAIVVSIAFSAACSKKRIDETPVLPPVDTLEPAVAAKLREVHAKAVEDPSARNWGRYAKTLHVHQMGEEAVPVYLLAADQADGPEKFELLYLAGHCCMDRDPDRAIVLLGEALKIRDDYVPLHLYLGAVHERLQRIGDARRHFEHALELSPKRTPSSDALAGLGRIQLAEGRIPEAVELLERARAADPEHAAVYVALAEAYARSGRNQDAAHARMLAGDVESTHAFADPVATSMSNEGVSFRALTDFGNAAIRSGQHHEALARFNQALEVRPDNTDALIAKATVLVKLERFSEAEAIAEKVLARRPESIGAITVRATCALARNDTPTAITWLRRGFKINPHNVGLRENLARCLRSLNRLAEAKSHFRFVLERKAHRSDVRFELASILAEERKNAEALIELEQVLLADPANKQALALKNRLSH